MFRKTKIICTLGPAVDDVKKMEERINIQHISGQQMILMVLIMMKFPSSQEYLNLKARNGRRMLIKKKETMISSCLQTWIWTVPMLLKNLRDGESGI